MALHDVVTVKSKRAGGADDADYEHANHLFRSFAT
jgi:hypothetical protein